MERSRESTTTVALTATGVLALAVLTASYIVGYFALCDAPRKEDARYPVQYRTYQAQWLATLYRPAAYVESLATGRDVETAYWSWSDE
jgi:hypothetical protein